MTLQAELFDTEGLAAYLGVPVNTLYGWRTLGKGPRGFPVGRHLRYRRAEVERRSAQLERAEGWAQ